MTAIERLQKAGIRRLGVPMSGFRYRTADGARAPAAQVERIRRLVLPPAWTDVFVSPSPSSAIQAIGRDRAGRWQYAYSEAHAKRREEKKRERLLAFLESLPRLRARISRDLAGEGLTRERVLAAMVRLLLRGYVRPGSQVYARENGTYGLTTLRRRHVRVQGSRILLSYPGKSGKLQTREIDDAESARVLRALRRSVAQAMKETSALLGNTPAVCRASYVSPVVLEAFSRGRVLEDPPGLAVLQRGSSRALARVEKQLIRMLGNGGRAHAAAAPHAGRAAA